MKIFGHIILHLTGFFMTSLCFWMVFAGKLAGHSVFSLALEDSAFTNFAMRDLGIFFLLSALSWALLFATFQLFRSRKLKRGVLKKATGSIIAETLIALPVLLTLVFGMIQLSLNYIGAILLDYGTFQAARTVWVWQPEAAGNRAGVSMGLVREMAKIQAALAVTPSAPGDYLQDLFAGSREFKDARAMILASQLPFLAPDMGLYAKPLVYALQLEDLGGLVETETFVWRSLGSSSFRLRSVRQFSFAYACVNVSTINNGNEVGARVTYAMYQSMPLVGRIFGGPAAVSGRPGFYSTMDREFKLATQFPANRSFP